VLTINLPSTAPNAIASVIKVDVKGKVENKLAGGQKK
jgi:hypothetical protein